MAFDPSIIMGYRGMGELPNPMNQLAQVSQIQNAQNQNALAQYQLSSAQRADEQQRSLYAAAANPDFKLDVNTALRYGPAGIAALKAQQEALSAGLTQQKLRGDIAGQPITQAHTAAQTQLEQAKYFREVLPQYAQNPTDQNISAMLKLGMDKGVIPFSAAKSINDRLLAMAPQDRTKDMLETFQDAKDALARLTPKIQPVTTPSGGVSFINMNAASPTAGQTPAAFNNLAPGMTPYQRGTLGVAQGNLGVNQAGLALRAITADPFNMSGAQTMFPLSGGRGAPMAPQAGAPVAPQAGAPVAPQTSAPVVDTISGKQMPLKDAINAGLTGPDLLSVMPKGLAGQVTAILEHRAAPPSGNTARSSQLMQLVQAADPTYDAQQYKTKQGIETAFTAGLPSRTLKSINVVADHLKVLDSTIDALNNNDVKVFNQIGNAISTQMGVPAPTDFNAVKRIVADELAKAVIGGVGALGDRKSIDDTINAASSPAALRSVIKRYQQLMEGQRTGLADQYKSGGGNSAGVLSLLNRGQAAKPVTPQGTGGFTYLGKEGGG